MTGLAFFLFGILLPNLVASSGEGNLHILENEVATAMRACITPVKDSSSRQKRSSQYSNNSQYTVQPRIDGGNQQELNQYSHERRNTSDMKDQIHVLNATDYDYESYSNGGAASGGEKLVNSVARPAASAANTNRTRRSDPLVAKPDSDQVKHTIFLEPKSFCVGSKNTTITQYNFLFQCLSQCIFANLQIVSAYKGFNVKPQSKGQSTCY